MKPILRWGVLGSGGIALRRTIPEGILPARNARLVAVYGRRPDLNAQVARTFGVLAATSVDDVLNAGVDAVYIASPPAAHLEQVLACARAGKHVLCEKPLGLTVTEVEQMIEACQSAGVRFGTAFMMRFSAQHQAALALVESGRLGTPVFARAQLSCWYPPIPGAWRQDPATGGGGSLIDLGGHCIDLLEMYFGAVQTVTCLTHRVVHDYPIEDAAVVTLRFANGALGTVDAFFCIPDEASRNRLELYGSLGSILAEGTIGQESQGRMHARLASTPGGYDSTQARAALDAGTEIQPAPINTYLAEIEAFGDAVLEQRDPHPGAGLGLRSQRILAACYESARSGRSVAV